jgi:H+/Cl- antiporter ClcA
MLDQFVGGLLAIGAGLALGREGPSVQMGASSAHLVGKLFRRSWPDCRVLVAAGAGAGLATAFNAPIAGAVFVLEELVQRFEHRIAIAALGASATAIGIARVLIGDAPDFHVGLGSVTCDLLIGLRPKFGTSQTTGDRPARRNAALLQAHLKRRRGGCKLFSAAE